METYRGDGESVGQKIRSACGHAEPKAEILRRGISVSTRWGWGPSASGKKSAPTKMRAEPQDHSTRIRGHRTRPALPALSDHIPPRPRVLFVGINPGIRSATIGHHFAGYSNRFWKLLFESKLVPEAIRAEEDVRLPEWGYGITNLVPRATPGIDTLKPAEYQAGLDALVRKVRRAKPKIVAFLGVTLFRAIFNRPASTRVSLGLQRERFAGARVF